MIDRRIPKSWARASVAVLGMAVLLELASTARADAKDETKEATPTMVVNLNTATEAELQQLPGIGPSKARAILELRQRIGRFTRVEQILRVRGIGRATFRKLRPMLTVGSAPPSKAKRR